MPGPTAALQEFLMELERDAARIMGKESIIRVEKEVGNLDDTFERLMNG